MGSPDAVTTFHSGFFESPLMDATIPRAEGAEDKLSFVPDCLSGIINRQTVEGSTEALNVIGVVQYVLNDVLGLVRAARRFVIEPAATGFVATKMVAIASAPFDLIAAGNHAYAIYAKDEYSDKALHSAYLLAALGSAVSNTSTFVQGLDVVAKISQPAVNVFNIMGPIAWVVSALGLIRVGHNWYKIDKDLEQIKALGSKKADETERLKLFNFYLSDAKGKALSNDDILGKLHVMGNIPLIESKPKIREHINELANRYMETRDPRIAKDFKSLVKQQYRMAKASNCMRIAAVVAGLAAMMFFYVPGVKNEKLGWLFLALSNAICVTTVAFDKLNSMAFLNEMEQLAKKHRKLLEEANERKEEFQALINAAFGENSLAI